MHRPSLPPGISWYSFLEAESTPGHMELWCPGTLRLVAQCLNHNATPGPYRYMYCCILIRLQSIHKEVNRFILMRAVNNAALILCVTLRCLTLSKRRVKTRLNSLANCLHVPTYLFYFRNVHDPLSHKLEAKNLFRRVAISIWNRKSNISETCCLIK
jgi:hypothetical protein